MTDTPERLKPLKFPKFRSYLRAKWEEAKFTDVVIMLATVAMAFTAYSQLLEMRDSGGQTDRIIAADERIAKAMEGTVQQATAAFNGTVEQFRLEQRAWVGVVSAEPPDLRPKSDFAVTLHVANSGRTPALNFQSLIILRSLKKSEQFQPVYSNSTGIRSHRVVQPGELLTLRTLQYSLTQSQIEAIENGDLILYVYGKMSYDDVFQKQHHTTFCKIILNQTLVEDCATYNTAD